MDSDPIYRGFGFAALVGKMDDSADLIDAVTSPPGFVCPCTSVSWHRAASYIRHKLADLARLTNRGDVDSHIPLVGVDGAHEPKVSYLNTEDGNILAFD